MYKFSNLSEQQLIMIAQNEPLHQTEINKEWYKRYRMNFPYRLNIRDQIINAMTELEVKEEDCDKKILEQANELRLMRKRRVSIKV